MPPLTTDPPLPQKQIQSAHASGFNAARSAGGGGVTQPSSAPHHVSPSHTSDSHNTILIYTPPLHIDGIYAGKLMKFALTVEQEPLFGRRKTEKDRRPLGPAPIIRLRAVECRDEPDSPSHEGIAEAE
ncbi:hypothetical protein L198_02794 [Cryptococcus wingfieldii CBS 7118]|uniref:Velvet domain-containing protein n=1 Tax=Cryptococcus wingfieldii CBS 7118 TaxID=1295528 RepID=A0A1E3JMM1_9TREE|nr:hypothetical protein L198_02794 [Cryptococcus wingfieldii CBS 7118]ODO02063.1 hypothetical protein L198_02794 [Cryptococcus wingfieldii CBS 7118]